MNEELEKNRDAYLMWANSGDASVKSAPGASSFYWGAPESMRVPTMTYTMDGQVVVVPPVETQIPELKKDFSFLDADVKFTPNELGKFKFELEYYTKGKQIPNKFAAGLVQAKGIDTNTGENILKLTNSSGKEILRFEQTGDIYVKNEFVTNDFQIVEGFREFLKHYKLHP